MTTNVSSLTGGSTGSARSTSSRGTRIALWISELAVAGVLGLMAFQKFFNFTDEGSRVLAEALGVGRATVTLIGVVEAAAVVLILLPRTRAAGALLAVLTMIGALFSHAVKIGWSGSPVAGLWPLAVLVLAAAVFVLYARRRELPFAGGRA